MSTVPELVHHYDTLSSPHQSPILQYLPDLQHHKPYSDFQLDSSYTMFTLSRSSTDSSSVTSDRSTRSTSPEENITYASPSSIHSSPSFASTDSFKYQGTSTSYRMNSLPQFSMSSMQGIMKAPARSQTSRPQTSRPRTNSHRWLTHRSLSRTLSDMERELNGDGIEAAGLGVFEPRPLETTVSRQSTQGSVVLDGIFEVMTTR